MICSNHLIMTFFKNHLLLKEWNIVSSIHSFNISIWFTSLMNVDVCISNINQNPSSFSIVHKDVVNLCSSRNSWRKYRKREIPWIDKNILTDIISKTSTALATFLILHCRSDLKRVFVTISFRICPVEL